MQTVDLRAIKSWRDDQLNLTYDTEAKKNKEKLRTQKPSTSEETVRAIVREGSPEWRSEITGGGVGFVEKNRF